MICYFTEMLIVLVCCNVPDVAVIVTPELNGVKEAHPEIVDSTATALVSASTPMNFLRRRLPGTTRHNTSVSPPPGRPNRSAIVNVVALSAAVIVSVLVTCPPAGVTVAGENEQVTPTGSPVHASTTGELKPLSGVTVTVAVAVDPCMTVTDELSTPNVKLVLVRLN
jgi:hypothetical protein